MATLTGAMSVALGTAATGVFANNTEVRENFVKTSRVDEQAAIFLYRLDDLIKPRCLVFAE